MATRIGKAPLPWHLAGVRNVQMSSTPEKKVHIVIARAAHSFVNWQLDSEISVSACQPYIGMVF